MASSDRNSAIEEKITRLEAELARGPTIGLLEEILQAFCESPAFARDPRRVRFVVDLIRIDPNNDWLATPLTAVDPASDPVMFEKGRRLWEDLVKAAPTSVSLAVGFASYVSCLDPGEARRILFELDQRIPGDPEVLLELAGHCEAKHDKLRYFEAARDAGCSHPNLGSWMARVAAELGELEKARSLARRLISSEATGSADSGERLNAAQRQYNWHWGQTVLGFAAAREGDLDEAVKRLHHSLEQGSEFRMRSHGPSMLLAEELCKHDEWSDVVWYLKAVQSFWTNASLSSWIKSVEARERPSFVVDWSLPEE